MKFFIFCVLLTLFSLNVFSKEVPTLTSPVIDEVDWISSRVESGLNHALKDYYKETGIQFQIYIAKSLEGESIESFSIKVADKWKLGGAKNDMGILLLVSALDRKMRIEVGLGLEGRLVDMSAGHIVDRMRPFFKNGEYEDGILFAVNMIGRTINEPIPLFREEKTIRNSKRRNGAGILLTIFILISIFGRSFLPLVLFSGGRFGGYGTRYRNSRGGFGGFSGGSSGWSGGGGGFSGGGASGDW